MGNIVGGIKLIGAGCALLLVAACGPMPTEEPLHASMADLMVGGLDGVTLGQAEEHLAAGRLQEARKAFARLATTAQGDEAARVRVGLADAMRLSGDAAGALDLYDTVLDVPALRRRALLGKGLALVARGDGSGGGEVLETLVAEDPGQWRAWNALGVCRDGRQEWSGAAEAYAMALKAQPQSPIVLNNSGTSLLLQGRFGEAAERFQAALRQDAKQQTVRNNLRLALAWQGRYRDALAGPVSDTEGTVLNDVGYVALLRGDYDKARGYLLKSMDRSPRFNAVAWNNLTVLDQMDLKPLDVKLREAKSQGTRPLDVKVIKAKLQQGKPSESKSGAKKAAAR